MKKFNNCPIQGVGVGLRMPHYSEIINTLPDIPWFEVLADNYMISGGLPLYHLEKIREKYPITMHSVSLSIGSIDPLNISYLKKLKHLIDEFEPAWVSDHLCWCSVNDQFVPDLLPLPFTKDVISHVSDRIKTVQDYLGQAILIENLSSYLQLKDSIMPEWEFIQAVASKAACFILLDVNNIYVSGKNQGFDPLNYIHHIDKDRVKEIHLAGFEDKGKYLLDSHSRPVYDEVWTLYKKVIKQFGEIPTLIEWDNDIPKLDIVIDEANKAKQAINEAQ